MPAGFGNGFTSDAIELLRMRKMCRERLESNEHATSGAQLGDWKYIEELEKELRNCLQEIGYLQDQLNLRNVEANCMAEHVHSLELKLAETGKLNEKIKCLSGELALSESRQMILMHDLKCRDEELQNYVVRIEKLETSVSSISLVSECEVESMKLDITALEQRCFEAERTSHETAHEKDRLNQQVKKFEFQLQEAYQVINRLECENKDLQKKLVASKLNDKGSFCNVREQLHKWLKDNGSMLSVEGNLALLHELNNLGLSNEICICEEVLGPFLSKLAVVTAQDNNVKVEMERMSSQIHESELLVKQLKEELRKEKLKAKEEAEDLIQEMAELRYEVTDMLQAECKRRACIEQVSLQRIQDLESEVQREKEKAIHALKQFQETQSLAERRAMELRKLKDELEGYRLTAEVEKGQKGCIGDHTSQISQNASDKDCISDAFLDAGTSDSICSVDTLYQSRIEWHSSEASDLKSSKGMS